VRIETVISHRACVAFFDVRGMVDRVWFSRASHLSTADGSAVRDCSSDLSVSWWAVKVTPSSSSFALASSSASDEEDDRVVVPVLLCYRSVSIFGCATTFSRR